MQFNYMETMVSQSPLDFNYKFGINDNSPDKFRCDNMFIKSNLLQEVKIDFSNNAMLQVSPLENMFSNEENYEVEIMSIRDKFNISWGDISLQKMQKIHTSSMYKSQINTSVLNMASIMMSGAGKINATLSIGDNVAGQAVNLVNALVDFGFAVYNLVNTINTYNDLIKDTKESVDKQIELLNEKIESNREFVDYHKQKIAKQKLKFEKVSG